MDMDSGGKGRDEEQDGMSVHSPCKAPLSSASSLPKEESQVELELRLLEALEIYPPVKLQGIHRHFVLYGLMEFLRKSFDRRFSSDEKPDDEEMEILNHEEDFCLPQSFFIKEES
ncbi:uncharacterized protein LOC121245528 isoform X2 [Juglans microcarpa x Juglans regia]|uniref:Uncharacterized protein n=2 Tax=Juglans regia TaxID=51240 RepID=A0A833WSQ2_JUGRE|nr:uncharacterized protein LOC109021631 isoform X2 [Juglans regia]XP_040999502.1 uncharacterized protein LOC121245528 isoform X2 [Juglans microcarpa x Juglans regia]KAF5443422.1 hypothetical protein F2P56_035977 [Juglans regia]